jgi:hypothetical protein
MIIEIQDQDGITHCGMIQYVGEIVSADSSFGLFGASMNGQFTFVGWLYPFVFMLVVHLGG